MERKSTMDLLCPGSGIIYLKAGATNGLSIASLVAQKSNEIVDLGSALWAYGGNTCHPTSMVQPFADFHKRRGKPIRLLIEDISTEKYVKPYCALEASCDGVDWTEIPDDVNVLGSRYAFVVGSLLRSSMTLPLHRTVVAIGPSAGRLGSSYVAGRVDMACLTMLGKNEVSEASPPNCERKIQFVGTLLSPYAVFLRGYRVHPEGAVLELSSADRHSP